MKTVLLRALLLTASYGIFTGFSSDDHFGSSSSSALPPIHSQSPLPVSHYTFQRDHVFTHPDLFGLSFIVNTDKTEARKTSTSYKFIKNIPNKKSKNKTKSFKTDSTARDIAPAFTERFKNIGYAWAEKGDSDAMHALSSLYHEKGTTDDHKCLAFYWSFLAMETRWLETGIWNEDYKNHYENLDKTAAEIQPLVHLFEYIKNEERLSPTDGIERRLQALFSALTCLHETGTVHFLTLCQTIKIAELLNHSFMWHSLLSLAAKYDRFYKDDFLPLYEKAFTYYIANKNYHILFPVIQSLFPKHIDIKSIISSPEDIQRYGDALVDLYVYCVIALDRHQRKNTNDILIKDLEKHYNEGIKTAVMIKDISSRLCGLTIYNGYSKNLKGRVLKNENDRVLEIYELTQDRLEIKDYDVYIHLAHLIATNKIHKDERGGPIKNRQNTLMNLLFKAYFTDVDGAFFYIKNYIEQGLIDHNRFVSLVKTQLLTKPTSKTMTLYAHLLLTFSLKTDEHDHPLSESDRYTKAADLFRTAYVDHGDKQGLLYLSMMIYNNQTNINEKGEVVPLDRAQRCDHLWNTLNTKWKKICGQTDLEHLLSQPTGYSFIDLLRHQKDATPLDSQAQESLQNKYSRLKEAQKNYFEGLNYYAPVIIQLKKEIEEEELRNSQEDETPSPSSSSSSSSSSSFEDSRTQRRPLSRVKPVDHRPISDIKPYVQQWESDPQPLPNHFNESLDEKNKRKQQAKEAKNPLQILEDQIREKATKQAETEQKVSEFSQIFSHGNRTFSWTKEAKEQFGHLKSTHSAKAMMWLNIIKTSTNPYV